MVAISFWQVNIDLMIDSDLKFIKIAGDIGKNFQEQVHMLMSLLIWYWHIPLYFCLYITFFSIMDAPPCDMPMQLFAWPLQPFAVVCMSLLPSLVLLPVMPLRPASLVGGTLDPQTLLLLSTFQQVPTQFYWWLFPILTLLIPCHDMLQPAQFLDSSHCGLTHSS